MKKEEILAKSREENLFLDECEKQTKQKSQAFGVFFTTVICILIMGIKMVCHQSAYDVCAILCAMLFATTGYQAYHEKSGAKFVIAAFSIIGMVYFLIKWIMAV